MKAVALILALCLMTSSTASQAMCDGTNENASSTIDPVLSAESGESGTGSRETEEETVASADTKTQANEAADYQFESKSYKSGKIIINYPQLVNLNDIEMQNSVNKIIKENALKDSAFLASEAGKITYELDYKVTFSSSGLISIRYTGYSYVDGAAHPNNFLFTTNIDVQNRTVIHLEDLVKINEGFVDVFKNGTYFSSFHDMTPEYKEILKENLNEYDTAGWVINLTNADTQGSGNNLAVYSYLTAESLVISVSIPHSIGDFFEIVIHKNKLDPYKTNNAVWNEIK